MESAVFRRLAVMLGLLIAAHASAQLVADSTTIILDGTITNLSSLTIGTNGASTRLVLTNDSRVTNSVCYIGYNESSSNNCIIVDGPGTLWSHGTLDLGRAGALNHLHIRNGGTAEGSTCTFGYLGSSFSNSVVVAGTNSTWTLSSLSSAKGANNAFIVTNGGRISSGSTTFRSVDSAITTGPGSAWTNSTLTLLRERNLLIISNRGVMHTSGNGIIGSDSAHTGNVAIVCGAGSLWRVGQLGIGTSGSGSVLQVTNGGVLSSASATIGSSTSGMANYAEVTGEGSFWTNSFSLVVGSAASFNQLALRDGARIVTSSCTIGSGANANGMAVTDTNSILQVRSELRVGSSSGSTGNSLLVGAGASVFANQLFIGNLSGSNSVVVTNGNLIVTNAISATLGTLILNSGQVQADSLSVTGALAGKLVLNGGTFRIRALASTVGTPRFTIGNSLNPAIFEMFGHGTNAFSPGGLLVASNSTLRGNGTIVGNVSLAAGATLSPGEAIGAISINGDLVLSNGSTVVMGVDTVSTAADKITALGTLTYGGTLQLSNSGPGAFNLSDAFVLFSAGTFRGKFTNIIPSSPGPGLKWNTNGLANDGILRVTADPTIPPVIASVIVGSGSIQFSIIGGDAFAPCYLLSTTNVADRLANWIRLQTNYLTASGGLIITNASPPTVPVRYFRIEVR